MFSESFAMYFVPIHILYSLLVLKSMVLRCGGIIGGEPAMKNEFPYVASVTLLGEPIGAGVILSLSFVVSPCHLFAEFDGDGVVTTTQEATDIRVFAGTVDSNIVPDENQQHRVPDMVLLHPYCNFNDFFTAYDFAILRLQMPFYHTHSIQPFEMAEHSEDILRALALKMNTNGLCTVVGWGAQTVVYSGEYINPSKVLKKTSVQLIDWNECNHRLCKFPKRFCDKFVFELGAICAVPIDGKGNCVGDDGGALICDDQIFGFASTPISCGELAGKPNLFARFDVAFDFLKSQSHM